MSAIEPRREQLTRLADLGDAGPVVMINLLEFRRPDGAQRYARYGARVQFHLERVGASVVYSGDGLQQVVGDGVDPWWHAIIVVRYPSIEAFLAMVQDPEYQAVHVDRAEALERAELIATSGWP